jgi:hypothetical protein
MVDIEIWVVYIIENSPKLQKLGLEEEISWESSSQFMCVNGFRLYLLKQVPPNSSDASRWCQHD